MTFNPADDVLATITVTYNPDVEILRRQLAQLPLDAVRIVVDNGSAPEIRGLLDQLVDHNGVRLIANEANVGLAAASNMGIRLAKDLGCGSVLLLDQDTEPSAEGIAALRGVYRRLQVDGARPGCIGPRMVDPATGLEHGFHRIKGWRWLREYPAAGSTTPIACANLNGSGTLMSMEVVDESGELDSALFIDHVDTEWAFRVLDAGFNIYGVPSVAFVHRMGDRSIRFWWLRWRLWPYRSPSRHQYLYRNAVALMRRGYIPMVWKQWAALKLLLTWVVHFLFDRSRFAQTIAMLKGIREGLHMPASKPGWKLQ